MISRRESEQQEIRAFVTRVFQGLDAWIEYIRVAYVGTMSGDRRKWLERSMLYGYGTQTGCRLDIQPLDKQNTATTYMLLTTEEEHRNGRH